MENKQVSVAIIPVPDKLVVSEGYFELDKETEIIVFDESSRHIAAMLNEYISPATGYKLRLSDSKKSDGKYIELKTNKLLNTLGDEGYKLTVTDSSIVIASLTNAGLFYGVQTLRQLLPNQIFSSSKLPQITWMIPCVEIEDKPRFKWRGMLLDVGRHFMSKEFVKKYIDLLAIHKMNIFHWHLTEDQGWRIEIKKYPKLTETAAWREETLIGHRKAPNAHKYDGIRHGGFYTQDEVREIVQYAKERFITIVPEIEMPGHSLAVLAAYPELSCTGGPFKVPCIWGVKEDVYCGGNEDTFKFLQEVLTEVIQLFPSEYIHIGGDECPKARWQHCPKCQKRIVDEKLKNEHELQGYFIKRIEKFLNKHGRKIIGWDEILEGGVDSSATVMSWRGEKGGIAAAKSGHDVIMTPDNYTYFDYYQAQVKDPFQPSIDEEPLAHEGFLPLEKVYSYNPVPELLTANEAKYIIGVQGQVWTEYIQAPRHAEYMAYPRGCALAEVAWSETGNKNYYDFYNRLKMHTKRLELSGVNYRKLDN